jgi:MerR family transcriptional regulator, light-induced transcriptional regulator
MGEARNSGAFGVGIPLWREKIVGPFERVRKRVAKPRHSDNDTAASIDAVIESEIIPRLLMAHTTGLSDLNGQRGGTPINRDDINHFVTLPLRVEAASLLDEVDALIDKGVSVESICIDLLAPAARHLGEMWSRDECDFIDVTMGLWRLQEVMREISSRSPAATRGVHLQRSALFSPMPGDDHNFGTMMIEEVFARAGWQSEALMQPERRELLDRLAATPFDLVGLTLTRDCPSDALGNLIKAIRGVSSNPHVSVIVGGRVINENPAIVHEVGADGTGADALSALEIAEQLVLAAPLRAQALR